jgi:predicted amidohydrolase
MAESLHIHLVQSNIVWEDRKSNLDHFDQALSSIQKADIIILPEMFDSGFTMNVDQCGQGPDGPTIGWLMDWAIKKDSAICGSLIIRENGLTHNRLVWYDPDSKVLQFYDKRHLFSIAEEHKYFNRGTQTVRVSFRSWNIALFICYDLRFPMWSSLCAGSDVMIYVANWPDKRSIAWNALLKARAIENQCYVAGVNRVGNDAKGIHYEGESQIIDYEGNILAYNKAQECVIEAGIELKSMQAFRRAYPFIKDNDAYQLE